MRLFPHVSGHLCWQSTVVNTLYIKYQLSKNLQKNIPIWSALCCECVCFPLYRSCVVYQCTHTALELELVWLLEWAFTGFPGALLSTWLSNSVMWLSPLQPQALALLWPIMLHWIQHQLQTQMIMLQKSGSKYLEKLFFKTYCKEKCSYMFIFVL